ncbi:HNH endonuclease [Pseudomonas resinovorans]|uniref:HNH endonuclease n=1 Tax=Metapseudomonas resinovorans TaxID=53412 RepID=UPI00237F20B3|nr:HNH endonuclease [Pseudomonas resinovorans]MDE3738585.1 HNH endonuclease [Pseudomonas resinovorans]
MAVTKGHGNPNWTREEVILALDLYHACGGQIPGPTDDRVRELSAVLRAFPYHSHAARQDSFRNPDGVAFKLQNLRSVATGVGLKNTSKVDREVWDEFGDDPARTHEFGNLIRQSIAVLDEIPLPEDEEEFSEGKAATKAHIRRERSRKLRKETIALRLKQGGLSCDLCSTDGNKIDPAMRESIFECHHVIPLSVIGETKTKVQDMALLCASCHRLLHRAIAMRKQWLSIEEAKGFLVI